MKNYKIIKKLSPLKMLLLVLGLQKKLLKLKSADGLVVGSAICKEITKFKSRQNPVINVVKLVSKLKENNMNWITRIKKASEE